MKKIALLLLVSFTLFGCNTENENSRISKSEVAPNKILPPSPAENTSDDALTFADNLNYSVMDEYDNSADVSSAVTLSWQSKNDKGTNISKKTKQTRVEKTVKNEYANKIIKTAHLRAEVEDYTKTYYAIKRFVSMSGGYIANENEEKTPIT